MENNQVDELALAELKYLLKKNGMDKEQKDMVNHPAHYGGANNPLEVIKIIDHYELGFALANSIKYILRADKKGNKLEDLKKAAWYLQHEINKLENL